MVYNGFMKFFKVAERELNIVKNLLLTTPVPRDSNGTLEKTEGRKGYRYTLRHRRNKEPSSSYVRRLLTAEEAAKVKQDRFSIELIKRLKTNEKALNRFLKSYQPYDPDSIWASLPPSYRPNADDATLLSNDVPIPSEITSLSSHPYFRITSYKNTYSNYSPQFTLKGRAVRSKSEALIGSALEAEGIDYLYDRIVELADGNGDITYLSPDFIILCPNGEIIIWEHFGLLTHKDYSEKAGNKFYLYSLNGFTTNKNLIFTSDSAEGSIFASSIKASIDLVVKPNL